MTAVVNTSAPSAARSAVVLLSGGGTNLQALLDAIQAGRLELEIRKVISNRPAAYGLERARLAGVATQVVNHQDFAGRDEFEAALARSIDEAGADLVILAGFMRVLGAGLVNGYSGRMINLHPSLLPKYRGLHTYRRALDAGDQEHGASVHFVTAELDGGPVIAQARIPILPADDETSLQQRLAPVEHHLLVAVTALFTQGRLSCNQGQVVLDRTPLGQPLVLNDAAQLVHP